MPEQVTTAIRQLEARGRELTSHPLPTEGLGGPTRDQRGKRPMIEEVAKSGHARVRSGAASGQQSVFHRLGSPLQPRDAAEELEVNSQALNPRATSDPARILPVLDGPRGSILNRIGPTPSALVGNTRNTLLVAMQKKIDNMEGCFDARELRTKRNVAFEPLSIDIKQAPIQ